MLANLGNLHCVILLCDDMPRMRTFYLETLGFPVHRDWEDWLEMRAGNILLTLRPRGRPYDGAKMANSAGVQLAFRVTPKEVNTCYTELLQSKVDIVEAPRDWEYGHRTLFFKDPDGNILEIYAEI